MTALVWFKNSLKLFMPLAKLLFLMQECTACLRYDECLDIWCYKAMSIEYTLCFVLWATSKGFFCVIYRKFIAWKILKWVHTVIVLLKGTEIPFASFSPLVLFLYNASLSHLLITVSLGKRLLLDLLVFYLFIVSCFEWVFLPSFLFFFPHCPKTRNSTLYPWTTNYNTHWGTYILFSCRR